MDRYGEPPKGVLNLIDVALLRAKAAKIGICDIRQKANEVNFTMTVLDFEAVSAVCGDAQYQNRVLFVPGAKQPTGCVCWAIKTACARARPLWSALPPAAQEPISGCKYFQP